MALNLAQFTSCLQKTHSLDKESIFYVAYSAGIDSSVLLHLLHRLRDNYPIDITALHVNHGLHANAEKWLQHCEKITQQWGVSLKTTTLSLSSSSEACARKARYHWLVAQTPAKATLLTGHHLQDRVETLLFNIMRGTGVDGLATLKKLSYKKNTPVLRPLLSFSQQEIQEYANRHQLSWQEDSSNQQVNFSRNRIRQQIIPQLIDFREDALNNIARTMDILSEQQSILVERADEDIANIRQYPLCSMDKSVALHRFDLQKISEARQINVLRFWCKKYANIVLDTHFLYQLQRAIAWAKPTTVLRYRQWQIRFYRDFVYLMPAILANCGVREIPWNNPSLKLALREDISLSTTENLTHLLSKHTHASLVVQTKHNIAKAKSVQGHSLSMKKWFQENAVPSWRRDCLLILTLLTDTQCIVLQKIDDTKIDTHWIEYE